MLGVRDIVWGSIIAIGLALLLYYRPLWSARSFVEEQCTGGFRDAYAGHRYRDGEVIMPQQGGAHLAIVPAIIRAHAVKLNAEEISMSGRRARFIVENLVIHDDGSPAGERSVTHFLVELEKDGSGWRYTLFRPRGGAETVPTGGVNPFVAPIKEAGLI